MTKNKNIKVHEKSKLQWACRRGMLELDVLLGNFLEERYPDLSIAEQELFILLLDTEDPRLFAWLMGYEETENPTLFSIIEAIKQHARNRVGH